MQESVRMLLEDRVRENRSRIEELTEGIKGFEKQASRMKEERARLDRQTHDIEMHLRVGV